MNFDLSSLYSLLANYDNLVVIGCLAAGFFARNWPITDGDRQTVVMLTGLLLGVLFLRGPTSSVPLGLVKGFIYAAVACVIYDYAYARIVALFKSRFGAASDDTSLSTPRPSNPETISTDKKP